MRVLYTFPGRIGRTGIGSTAWHQVRGLVDLGADVVVMCGSCERPLDGATVVQTLTPLGIRLPYRLFGFERAARWHDARVARHIGRRSDRFDVVHGWPLGSLQTLRAAGTVGVPSFLERPNTHTRHAYDVVARELAALEMTLPEAHSHRMSPRRLAHELREYELADFLLCPSEAVAETFLDAGVPQHRVVLTQYGYEPRDFPASVRPHRPDDEPLVVGFVGSCEPRKGLHYALQAWERSGIGMLAELRIYGTFVPTYRDRLGQLLDLPGVVHHGFTADVPQAMASCDVIVVPSIEEGSALVTYEARGAGCVLMASTAAGARCTHMVDGLLHEPGDVDTIAQQLRMLADDRSVLRRLRDASLAGTDQLTWHAAAHRLAEVYRAGRERLAA